VDRRRTSTNTRKHKRNPTVHALSGIRTNVSLLRDMENSTSLNHAAMVTCIISLR
jgi:hypothetical protein